MTRKEELLLILKGLRDNIQTISGSITNINYQEPSAGLFITLEEQVKSYRGYLEELKPLK